MTADAPSLDVRHLYVHVPFCARRCSYCDFSIAVRRTVPVHDYVTALRAELTTRLGSDRRLHLETLYFGGGTPSHLGPDGVRAMLDVVREFASWPEDAEVTLEANPDDVSTEAARGWLAAGVTRVSLGAQSFDPGVLAWMHRSHSVDQVHRAVDVIRDTAFASWSFDLIFALPASLGRDWARDLTLALEKEPPHLSLYGLTVEPGTPLGRWASRGEVRAADDSAYEHEFLSAHAAAESAGLEHYEVSNFGRRGHHARHNRSYWTGARYLGIGPAAHGYDGRQRRWNVSAYAAWLAAAMRGVDPIGGTEVLDSAEQSLEAVYLGLRTTAGLEIGTADAGRVAPWITAGWAHLDGNILRLTPLGWLRLDTLAASLTPVPVSH